MRCRPVLGLLVLLTLSAGCAALSARSAFTRGQKAERAGDMDGAIAAYEEANRADPKPAYAEAIANVRREGSTSRQSLAREAETRGDFAEAAKQWRAAARFEPDEPQLEARAQLATLRTKQGDPVEYYKAAKRLAELLPNDASAQAALAEAKKNALSYHLRLASVYSGAKAWAKAYAEYDVARSITSDHPAFKSVRYRETAAHHHEAEGDRLLAEGDALAAYQAYDRASALGGSRALPKKMRRAKRGAGDVLEQLRQAKTFFRLKRWEDAAEAYSLVAARKDASEEVRAEATEARAKSAALRAERAKAYAERNLPAKATAELVAALEHSDGPIDAVRAAQTGADELLAEQPGRAHAHFEKARSIAPNLPVIVASPLVLAAVAKKVYERAQVTALDDPAGSLVTLRRLEPFQKHLSGYDKAKKRLRKRAFGALLSRAEERAGQRQFDRAAELLATALEISKPPKKIAAALDGGTKALTARDYALALERFQEATTADPRSRLASTGRSVARRARLTALRRDADEARVVEDAVRASMAYRAILEVDPDDDAARIGLDALRADIVASALSNAKVHRGAGRKGAAFVYYSRILSLDPNNPAAKSAAAALQNELDTGGSAGLFVAPVLRGNHLGSSCKKIEQTLRDRLALYLARTSDLGVNVLDSVEHDAVDAKKRARPPILLRTAVESCDVSKDSGSARVTLQLLLGDRVLGQQSVDGEFDPRSIPKDELEDGLDPERVQSDVVGDAAKHVAAFVKSKRTELAAWRAVEARASLASGDAERVARAYAGLVKKNGSATGEERAVLDEIRRFLDNRYR